MLLITLENANKKGSALFELKGLQECLQDLASISYTVRNTETDRNRQVPKRMREKPAEIEHKLIESWHFAKNIKAKLRPLSQQQNCRSIYDLVKVIGNHLFMVCSNYHGDLETLV